MPECSELLDCESCSTGYSSASNGVCYWCPNSTSNKCIDPDKEILKFKDNQATCSRDCSPTDPSSNAPVVYNECSMVKDCASCTNMLIPDSDGGYCSWNPSSSSCSAFEDTGNILHGATCPTTPPATSCTTLKDCTTCSSTKIGNDSCYWDSVFNKCDVYSNTVNVATDCSNAPAACASYSTEPLCTSNMCAWDASKSTCGDPIVPYVEKCTYIETSELCKAESSCLWDASKNKCTQKDVAAYPNMDEMSLEDMLVYLANLQKVEEKLYKLLTNSAQNITSGVGGMTQAELDIIVEQINSLSMQRSNLYGAVALMYNNQAQYEDRMGITIGQQITTLKLLEAEMNKSKQLIQNSKDDKIKTMKMVEINTYFSHEYAGYTYIMKIVALIAVLLLAATFLSSYSPGMSEGLFKLISYVGGAYVLYLSIDLMQRRNTNFDEYTFPTAPTTDADMASANANQTPLDVSGVDLNICAGSFCCADGTEWNDNYGCVPSSI